MSSMGGVALSNIESGIFILIGVKFTQRLPYTMQKYEQFYHGDF
jgi:hypothetical protein